MTQIQSMGYTKTYINNNNNIQEKEIEWRGNKSGDNLNIQLAVNDNGQKEQMNIQLDKNDIMDLLKTQPIGIPLTTRLQNDFFLTHSVRRKRKQRHGRKTRTKHRNKQKIKR
jgi:hypothetical protein